MLAEQENCVVEHKQIGAMPVYQWLLGGVI